MTETFVGVAATGFGVVLGGAISWWSQRAIQEQRFKREDKNALVYVRAVIASTIGPVEAAYKSAQADPLKWEPYRTRLDDLIRPDILGALSDDQRGAVVKAQQDFDIAFVRLDTMMGSPSSFIKEFQKAGERPNRDALHSDAMEKIMAYAEPAYDSLLAAASTLGVDHARVEQQSVAECVNRFREEFGIPLIPTA